MNKESRRKLLQLFLLQGSLKINVRIYEKVVKKLQYKIEQELRELLDICQPYCIVDGLNKKQKEEIKNYYVEQIVEKEKVNIYIPYRPFYSYDTWWFFINCYNLTRRYQGQFKILQKFLEDCKVQKDNELSIMIKKKDVNVNMIYKQLEQKTVHEDSKFKVRQDAQFDREFMDEINTTYQYIVEKEKNKKKNVG